MWTTTEATTLVLGPMSRDRHREVERAAANSANLPRDLVVLDFSQRLRIGERVGVEAEAEAGVEVAHEQMYRVLDGLLNLTWTTNTQTMVAHPKSIHGEIGFWLVLQE